MFFMPHVKFLYYNAEFHLKFLFYMEIQMERISVTI